MAIAWPPRTVFGRNVSMLPPVDAALSQVASTESAARIGPFDASHAFHWLRSRWRLKYDAILRCAAAAYRAFSLPVYIFVVMWNGNRLITTAPYLRTMSIAALSDVPASSTNVSGRSVYSSVSFEPIHTKRGDSCTFLASLVAFTM